MSETNYGEQQMLENFPDEPWVKLHVGDPGEEGTANPAAETTRKQVTLGAASGGTRKATTDAIWEEVSTSEDYTHVSLWDHPTAGNPWRTLELDEKEELSAGDTFRLLAEDEALSISQD